MVRELLTHRGYVRWSAGAQAARLPEAMAPLAFTAVAGTLTGSAAAGGAMVAAMVAAEVACAVPAGRLLDRLGVARGARWLLVARTAAYLGLLAAVVSRLSTPVLMVLAAVSGVLGAGVLGGFRALLSGVVPQPMLHSAVAVNAMVVDGIVMAGPVLVGGLALLSGSAPLLVMAGVSLAAAALVPRASAQALAPVRPRGGLLPPLARWAVAAFALGHLCSTIEVCALPVAQRLGDGASAASVLVAVFCGASVAGSLAYTAGRMRGTARTAGWLLTVMAVGGTLVAVSPGWGGVLAGAVLAGCCVGPAMTVNSVRAEEAIPQQRRAEGFAILNTAQGIGFALGSLTLAVLPLTLVGLCGAVSALIAAPLIGLHRQRAEVGSHRSNRTAAAG